jgi:protein SCO1/2
MLALRISPSAILKRATFVVLFLIVLSRAHAYRPGETAAATNETPMALEEVGIQERLGSSIDLDLAFVDQEGKAVTLRDYFVTDKPVLLTLVYYGCGTLCNFHLNGLTEVAKKIPLDVGSDFQVVAVSIDPNEGPPTAQDKLTAILKEYGDRGNASGWHFLTGKEESIKALASQVGFKYRWDEKSDQWAHAAAAYIVTPKGAISRYLYGIDFLPQDLRLSLLEAADGNIGSIVDRIVLFCFQFDPTKNRYTLYAYNIMRAGAGATVVVMLLFFLPFWMRMKREKRKIKE